jgi:acyl-CoA thioesterase I
MALSLPQGLLTALMLLAPVVPASAQPPPTAVGAAPAAVEPALSAECRAPEQLLFVPGKLPNLDASVNRKEPIRVLALGPFHAGSLGAGPIATKYTTRLQAELGRIFPGVAIEVEARRLPGETTSGAPEYVANTVMEVDPDLVVWSVGSQDAMARAEVEPFAAAVGEIIEWLRSNTVDVVLVEPPYAAAVKRDEHYSAIVRALRGIARTQNVPIVLRYDAIRYIAAGQVGATLGSFGLQNLSRHCTVEYTALAIAASTERKP